MIKTDLEPVRRPIAPIHLVNDFGNGLSPAECEQAIRRVYADHGVTYEPPHAVSDIQPFNITDGAFVIYQLAQNVPDTEAVFVGVVDPGVGSERKGVAVATESNHVFVGPDNGLFGPVLLKERVREAYKIDPQRFAQSSVTFHGRDQFSPIAAQVSAGVPLSEIEQLQRIRPTDLNLTDFKPGQVVELDGYNNAKIWQHGVPRDAQDRRADGVTVRTPHVVFKRGLPTSRIRVPVVDTFDDVKVGGWLAYEGSSNRDPKTNQGLVEIAVRERSGKQNAGGRLKLEVGDVLGLNWRFPKTQQPTRQKIR